MTQWALSGARAALTVAFWGFVGVIAVLSIGSHATQLTSLQLYAVRSGSMAPELSVGTLVTVDIGRRRPDVGDVVAYRLESGAVVVHRVVAVEGSADHRLLTTKGDANGEADAVPVRDEQVVGTTRWQFAIIGYLLAMLSMPSGILSIACVAASLVCAEWLLEDVQGAMRARGPSAGTVAPARHTSAAAPPRTASSPRTGTAPRRGG